MGHYAKVLNNKVIQVLVADSDFMAGYIDTSPGTWLKTSYNTSGGKHYTIDSNGDQTYTILSDRQDKAIRKNFAGIGFNYDPVKDAFYSDPPFDSWVLDSDTYCWKAPITNPHDPDKSYWHEGDKEFKLFTKPENWVDSGEQ